MDAEEGPLLKEMSETQIKLKKKLAEPAVLDSFTKLTSDVEKVRLSAGVRLLKHLVHDSDKVENEQSYALDRLIRGVGSSKLNSKTGFYSVLVSFLTSSNGITVEDVLAAISKHLTTGSSNSKSENADICTGQILAAGALVHSGRYTSANDEEQKKIIEILITAGNKRSYLSLASYSFLIEILEKCDEIHFQTVLWPVIKPENSKPWKEQNLDTIYFLSVARTLYPNVVKHKFLNKNLNTPEIIHEDSIKPLCELLLNVIMLASIKHPIYNFIGKKIAESNIISEWCSEMNQQLMKPTRNKHLITTHLSTIILQNMTNFSEIPNMLTDQFVTITLNTFKNTRAKDKNDDFLIYTSRFFEALENTLKKEEVSMKIKISVIKKCLFYPGTLIFEKITRTKLIQHITMGLNDEGVKKLSKLYREVINANKERITGDDKSDHWINMDRVYATNLLIKLVGHPSVQKENEWKLQQAKFLLKLGLFKTDGMTNVGAELAASLKECFFRILDTKFSKLEELRNYLSSLVHFINEEIFVPNKIDNLRTEFPEEGIETWKNMMTLVETLEQKKKLKHNYAVPVFHTLLLQMGLQLLSDYNMAENTLKELQSCYKRLESSKKTDNDSNEPMWIEVIVDLFLSLLSQNSHLLRTVIGCVFPYLCPHLTLQALHQILDVLDPKKDDNPLSKNKDSDDENEDDSSDEDEKENGGSDNEEEKISDESDISDLEEEEMDQEHETTTDKLRMAVRDVLYKSGYKSDDESVDMDEMDEEEGNKLDEALAEAFKNIKKSKGKNSKQNKDDKTLTHFRVRVLDLIEMYFDSEPSMLFCLEITVMLLQILEFSIRDAHQIPLEHRVRSCLKKLSSIKKFSSMDDVTESTLLEMLNSFINKGSKSAFICQDMGEKISDCVLFLIRCSQLLPKENITPKKLKKKILHLPIVEVLKTSLEQFFMKRDSLLPLILFKKIIQTTWEGNWALVPLLVEYPFNNDIRPFRRTQALELLRTFYNNHRFRLSDPDIYKKKINIVETKLFEGTVELLKSLSENPKSFKVKEKFMCQLLHLLSSIKNSGKNKNLDWTVIGNLVREYRSHVSLSNDAKSAYSKLCHSLGVPTLVKMHIVANGVENSDIETQSDTNTQEDDKKVDRKRKKIKSQKKDKAKLKKEARLLRMQAGAEGLEQNIDFSNVSLKEVKNDEVTSENDEHELKSQEKSPKKRHNSQHDDRSRKKKKRNSE